LTGRGVGIKISTIRREIVFFRRPGERRIGSAFDREWRKTGSEDELWAQVETWEELGYLPPNWRHPERGTGFEGMGPPGTTVRIYYAEHARQIVLLHATSGKPGRGKLAEHTKSVVRQRLRQWREWFPNGADVDEVGRLTVKQPQGGKR